MADKRNGIKRAVLGTGVILALILFVLMLSGCAGENGSQEAPHAEGHVTEIEKYGHAVLDITVEDFTRAGFELGDVVTVTAGSYTGDMPYFNGYYVDKDEYMLRAYPGDENIAICINYGNFASASGVGPGDDVSLTLKEKAGALLLQEISDLEYTNERDDYPSDQVFANFRPVSMGGIAEGRLYRSASPVNDQYGRAAYANALAEEAGISAVMNIASTDDEIAGYFAEEGFQSDYYKSLYDAGKVIALGMPIDFSSDSFGEGIAKGLTFLSENEGPYLVHCNEGKDRAGFACMIIEALMGADPDEIRTDYMLSYVNYYGLEPGTDKYNMIAEKNIDEMMRMIAGLDKEDPLEGADLKTAAETYLTAHGMSEEAIRTFREKLR